MCFATMRSSYEALNLYYYAVSTYSTHVIEHKFCSEEVKCAIKMLLPYQYHTNGNIEVDTVHKEPKLRSKDMKFSKNHGKIYPFVVTFVYLVR